MPWLYDDAWLDGGVALVRIRNAADGEVEDFRVMYYGTGDPATDPAFATEVQTQVAGRIAGKEQARLARINQKERFRPRAQGGPGQ